MEREKGEFLVWLYVKIIYLEDNVNYWRRVNLCQYLETLNLRENKTEQAQLGVPHSEIQVKLE